MFDNLPAPLKMGLMVISAGGLLGVVYLFVKDPTLLMWIGGGIAVIMILLFLYRLILAWRDKAKGSPFAKLIAGSASGGAGAAMDPAKKARMDDLRKKFEEGVTTFRAAGKDLYALPWYLLVGPSGSGKTEMLRHSNIGFPPGLQDCLQGAGGTVNMHWWFTNHAVVLDTAGRMFMEEVDQSQNSEWKEFLKMMRQARSNCPVNGMLLVIGIDSLIKDSAEQIEQKAGKIARQLDGIQRILDVRFPVYVVVTKCDLIPGFREFFDNIDDPQLQHQILGWSNPNNLDNTFNPDEVDKYLASVRDRLQKRRLSHLLDPVHTEDPQARRTDQVDELFALPDNLARIGPRLKRYLQLIFVAGEWSPKPLFLRGIYFTSSMREGDALDADIAQALGVPVDALPGGKIWDKEKSFFLRDLFMAKVFKEKGLVTRAANVDAALRKRKVALLGTGFALTALLLGVTVFGGLQFRSAMGEPKAFWEPLASAIKPTDTAWADADKVRMVGLSEGLFRPTSVPSVEVDGAPVGGPTLLGKVAEQAGSTISIPAVFKPATLAGDLNAKQGSALRGIIETGLLVPALDHARARLARTPWTPDSTAALAELLKLRTLEKKQAMRGEKPAGEVKPDPMPQRIDPVALLKFGHASTRDKSEATFDEVYSKEMLESITSAVEKAYPQGKDGIVAGEYPSAALTGGEDAQSAAEAGVAAFVKHWNDNPGGSGEGLLAKLRGLRDSMGAFAKAERDLLNLRTLATAEGSPKTGAEFAAFADQWKTSYAALTGAQQNLTRAWARLSADDQNAERQRLIDRAKDDAKKLAEREFELLLSVLPAAPKEGEKSPAAEKAPELVTWREEIAKGFDGVGKAIDSEGASLAQVLPAFWDAYLAKAKDQRAFQARFAMYEAADKQMQAAMKGESGSPSVAQVVGLIADLGKESDDAAKRIEELALGLPGAGGEAVAAGKAAQDGTTRAVRAAQASRMTGLLRAFLKSAPMESAAVEALVVEQMRADGLVSRSKPTIQMTSLSGGMFEDRFHPDAAAKVLAAWGALRENVSGPSKGSVLDVDALKGEYESRKAGFEGYITQYVNYWSIEVPGLARVKSAASWTQFYSDVGMVNGRSVNSTLRQLLDTCVASVGALPRSIREDERVAAQDKSLKGQLALVSGDDFVRDCDDQQKAILNLGRDSREAASRLRQAASTPAFRIDYMKSYRDRDGSAFWNSLLVETLRTLATEASGQARAVLEKLRARPAFPLARDAEAGQQPWSAAELAGLGADVATLEKAAGSGGAASFARTNAKEIDDQLEVLLGSLVSASEKQVLERIRAVIKGLVGDGRPDEEPLKFEVRPVVRADAVEGANPVVGRFEKIEFRLQGQNAVVQNVNLMGDKDAQKVFDLPARGVPVRIAFFNSLSDTNPVTELSFGSDWAGVELLQQSGARLDQGGAWGVPVMVNADGKRFVLWLSMKPSRELPRPSDWPTRGSWLGR